MMRRNSKLTFELICKSALALLLSVLAAHTAAAQSPGPPGSQPMVSIRASTEYERGDLWRTLFGETWRAVWEAPFMAPVLDLDTYAGGLTPFKKGGNQSRTLRFHGADGREYIFRSTDKDIHNALPPDLAHTPIGDVIQDQTSAFHPSAAVAVALLSDAVGLLNATPTIVVMPDDARLGEFRADFRNTLGQIEERPDESEKGSNFGGAEKIISTENLLEELEESSEAKVDGRDYLKARLFDFIIGDTDRGADQWRWARFDRDGLKIYRPIPRDRDYAFMRTEGLLTSLAAHAYPKLTRFGPEFPMVKSLVFMTAEFDRSHLVELPWAVWDSTITDMQRRLSDDVIEGAIAQIPPPQRDRSERLIREGLRGRRAALRSVARAFYALVNEDADVFASDDNERADIDRTADGGLHVRIYRESKKKGEELVFDRVFVPEETQEIYLHMERGDDRVVVRGTSDGGIQLRIMGGEGDDVLIDSGYAAHGDETRIYDAGGHNTIMPGGHTDVIRRPFFTAPPAASADADEAAEPEKNPRQISEERRGRFQDMINGNQGFVEQKTKSENLRMWGKKTALSPLVGYSDGPGLMIGFGPTKTEFGFRRRPYEWRAALRALYGFGSSGFGLQLSADRHFEMTPWSVSVFVHATQLQANRFYGYGNNTARADLAATLIMRDELLLQPAINYRVGSTTMISAGPVVRYVRPHVPRAGPAELLEPLGTGKLGQVGVRAEFSSQAAQRLPDKQQGLDFSAGASAYPAFWDVPSGFGEAHALARLFVPVGRPTIALRAGGKRVWGDFPLHEAAFVGASESLRGYRWNRFAGDAAAFGSAELHVPITQVSLLIRGTLGLIGFSDAGRVWLDGASVGAWHTSVGGGLSFASLGSALSVTYAQGEEGRVYFSLGYPF